MRAPFENAVRDHGPTVLRVCRAVLGPVDADDAWSETFVSAMQAWPDLPDDANVEAWLVTIAHRRALDVGRSRSRAPEPRDEPVGSTVPGTAPGPEGVGEHDDLYAALRALTPRQRQAVAYHHLVGLPHGKVAAILGCSPAAARRASADGIAAVRRHLADGPGST